MVVNRLADLDQLPSGLRFTLAIGMFDGVHRGHQRVIKALTSAARRMAAEPVVLTFDPHPAAVLRGNPPALLCDPEERIARLADLGVSTIVAQHFDREFADQPPDEFVERLRRNRDLAGLVLTAESAFGRDRTGGLPAIRGLARELGFQIIEVPRLASDGNALSSTRLRTMISAGQLAMARRLLGRDHAVIGTVVEGDHRGRTLGYPTANLAFDHPVALPPDGIYAVRASWAGPNPLLPAHAAHGAASLGVRPTFGVGARLLEVYLLDFDGDLYGQRLRVEFVRRLRGEKRFGSVESLVQQMARDVERVRTVLAARDYRSGVLAPPARD